VREFVGDLKDTPLAPGSTYRGDARNWTLHSLQDIVSNNNRRGIVTLICPWSVDGSNETAFCGSTPTHSAWYADYKTRMRAWVAQIIGQPAVWIEVMNEPFVVLNTPEDDALWLA
jgi:hypothetical protein